MFRELVMETKYLHLDQADFSSAVVDFNFKYEVVQCLFL